MRLDFHHRALLWQLNKTIRKLQGSSLSQDLMAARSANAQLKLEATKTRREVRVCDSIGNMLGVAGSNTFHHIASATQVQSLQQSLKEVRIALENETSAHETTKEDVNRLEAAVRAKTNTAAVAEVALLEHKKRLEKVCIVAGQCLCLFPMSLRLLNADGGSGVSC